MADKTTGAATPNGADTPVTAQIGQKVREQTEQVKQQAQQQTEQVKQQAQQVVQQGQQAVSRALDTGRTQLRSVLTGQKDRVADTLDDYVHLLQQIGGQLREQGKAGGGQVAERLADRIGQASGALHEKEVEEIIADTEEFARQQPVVFLSAVGLLGFVLVRFLKSSSQGLATGRA